MKKIAILTGIGSLLLFTGIAQAGNSDHHLNPWQLCGEGVHLNNPHCIAPTIIDPCNGDCEITATPEATIQPILTVVSSLIMTEPVATPTATITAGVTAQPTVTPSATPTPTGAQPTGTMVVPQGAPDTSLRE